MGNDSVIRYGVGNDSSGNQSMFDDLDYEGFPGGRVDLKATLVIAHIILPIICACGILGIILTIIVLSHKNMCTSTNCYLMALAIADLLFLVLLIPRLAENQLEADTQSYYTYQIYAAYSADIGNMCLLASIWVTVMLALERYIAVCKPFLAAKLCSVSRARMFIVSIFVTAVLVRVVNFWQYKVHYYSNGNVSVHFLKHTEFSYHQFWHIYALLVDVFLASVIPFVILLVTNILLIQAVRRSTRYLQRNQLAAPKSTSAVQREELQITIMLISVIIVFFICQAPYVIYVAIASMNKNNMMTSGFFLFKDITMLLLTLKSAVNFILYCWFSERFRATLKRTFCTQFCLKVLNKKPMANSYITDVTEATTV